MLIIDSKIINTDQIKIYFSRVNGVVSRVFLGIPVYIATANVTEESSPSCYVTT